MRNGKKIIANRPYNHDKRKEDPCSKKGLNKTIFLRWNDRSQFFSKKEKIEQEENHADKWGEKEEGVYNENS